MAERRGERAGAWCQVLLPALGWALACLAVRAPATGPGHASSCGVLWRNTGGTAAWEKMGVLHGAKVTSWRHAAMPMQAQAIRPARG